MASAVAVTAVVPAFNAEQTLLACLDALARSTSPVAAVIVVDDGSTDRTRVIAKAAGALVIGHDGPPQGPASARNQGVEAALTDVVLFVDADVALAPDAVGWLLAEMAKTGAAAAFGSYDDRPRSRRTTSLYANLRHHFIHQRGARDISTFWSGIGLVRRDAFLSVGGFDAAHFPHPSIEDIELGTRLIGGGHRIRLVPEAQGTHMKDWSLWRIWHTDVVRRAIPWSRLIASGRSGADLNIDKKERWTALAALTFLGFLSLSLFSPMWLVPTVFTAGAYLWLTRHFTAFLAGRLYLGQTLAAVLMHWCYYVYASVTFVTISVIGRQ